MGKKVCAWVPWVSGFAFGWAFAFGVLLMLLVSTRESARNRRNSAFVWEVRISHCLKDEAQKTVSSSLCSENPIVKWNSLPIPDLTTKAVLPVDNSFEVWRLFRPV